MPNWVTNVLILTPTDAKKTEPFIDVIEDEAGTSIPRFDFAKIVPMPDTVYQAPSVGVGKDWHPEDMTLEEYHNKYPDGNWYDWSIHNWGCKWNACSTEYNPPEEGDDFGTLVFNTPWGTPTPVMLEMHNGKKVDFIHYYTEEANFFRGAVAYTDNLNYPQYCHDPEGNINPKVIYEVVHGELEWDWMLRSEYDRIEHWVATLTEYRKVLRKFSIGKSPGLALFNHDDFESIKKTLSKIVDNDWLNEYDVAERSAVFNDFMEEDEIRWWFDSAYNNLENDKGIEVVNSDAKYHLSNLNSALKDAIQTLRRNSVNHIVGITREKSTEIISSIYATAALKETCYQNYKEEGVDNLLGRRLLYNFFLSRYSGVSVVNSLEYLASIRRESAKTESEGGGNGAFYKWGERDNVTNALDVAAAMIELYNELPGMTGNEFLRLIENYRQSNLFLIETENVDYIDAKLGDEVDDLLRKLRVIQFKNAFRLDRKFY